MLRFVGFAGGLDKQLFRLGFGAIEIERRSRRFHGFLLVAIAVDGLDVLLGLALHFVFDALEVFGRLPIELVGIILVDADVFLRGRAIHVGSFPFARREAPRFAC